MLDRRRHICCVDALNAVKRLALLRRKATRPCHIVYLAGFTYGGEDSPAVDAMIHIGQQRNMAISVFVRKDNPVHRPEIGSIQHRRVERRIDKVMDDIIDVGQDRGGVIRVNQRIVADIQGIFSRSGDINGLIFVVINVLDACNRDLVLIQIAGHTVGRGHNIASRIIVPAKT